MRANSSVLTMRANSSVLILRSRAKRGVSKDGPRAGERCKRPMVRDARLRALLTMRDSRKAAVLA
jgi:hypothetical protein